MNRSARLAPCFACLAEISRALNYDTFFKNSSTQRVLFSTAIFSQLGAACSHPLNCVSHSAEPRILYRFFTSGQLQALSFFCLSAAFAITVRFQQSPEFYTGFLHPVNSSKLFLCFLEPRLLLAFEAPVSAQPLTVSLIRLSPAQIPKQSDCDVA